MNGVWRVFWQGTAVLATGAIMLGILVYVMYLGSWGLYADSVDRQDKVFHSSGPVQLAQESDLRHDISVINGLTTSLVKADNMEEKRALKDQRHALLDEACATASAITTIPADMTGWVGQNCAAGAVSPSSPIDNT